MWSWELNLSRVLYTVLHSLTRYAVYDFEISCNVETIWSIQLQREQSRFFYIIDLFDFLNINHYSTYLISFYIPLLDIFVLLIYTTTRHICFAVVSVHIILIQRLKDKARLLYFLHRLLNLHQYRLSTSTLYMAHFTYIHRKTCFQ